MPEPAEIREVRLCIDANDVDLVGEFWVALLGYRARALPAPDEGWRHLDPTLPHLPPLTIQPVPEPKSVKNRLHLDVFVEDTETWIARAVELGGVLGFRSEDPDDWFQVIADPEGNELCICRAD